MTPAPRRDSKSDRPVASEASESSARAERRPTMLRFAGAGIELAGLVLGAAFLGHLLDRSVLAGMERPWGLVAGALLGFAAGMGRLFVLAKKFNR